MNLPIHWARAVACVAALTFLLLPTIASQAQTPVDRRPRAAQGVWERVFSGSTHGLVADPNAPGHLFAGDAITSVGWESFARIFVSYTDDGGDTWTRASGPPPRNASINSIGGLVVAADGGLYVSQESWGVYRTYDLGLWEMLFTGRPIGSRGFKTLVADPLDASRLYGIGSPLYSELWRSTDGGITWEPPTSQPSCDISALAVHALDSRYLYAGGACRLVRSRDSGVTWELAPDGPTSVRSISLDPTNPLRVVIAGGFESRYPYEQTGVWETRDGGDTWTLLDARETQWVLVDPRDLSGQTLLIYDQKAHSVRWSRDSGVHWEDLGGQLCDAQGCVGASGIVVSGDSVYIGGSGVWRALVRPALAQ